MPGAQGVIYDTALRGVHHQHLLRELGLLPINRVTAAKAGAKKPRRNDRRVEKNVHIEDKTVTLADGTTPTVHLYASGGALGIAELDDTGTQHFVPIARVRTHRNRDKNGRYRWYNDYQLPARYDDQIITVRLHGNDEDPPASSTAPRTSGRSRPATPTSNGSSRAATTPNPSTATSTTPCGSDAPTASATHASTSTSSASPSPSTRSRSTDIANAKHHRSPPDPSRAGHRWRSARRNAIGAVDAARYGNRRPRRPSGPILSGPAPGFLPPITRPAPAPVAQGIEHRFPNPGKPICTDPRSSICAGQRAFRICGDPTKSTSIHPGIVAEFRVLLERKRVIRTPPRARLRVQLRRCRRTP